MDETPVKGAAEAHWKLVVFLNDGDMVEVPGPFDLNQAKKSETRIVQYGIRARGESKLADVEGPIIVAHPPHTISRIETVRTEASDDADDETDKVRVNTVGMPLNGADERGTLLEDADDVDGVE